VFLLSDRRRGTPFQVEFAFKFIVRRKGIITCKTAKNIFSFGMNRLAKNGLVRDLTSPEVQSWGETGWKSSREAKSCTPGCARGCRSVACPAVLGQFFGFAQVKFSALFESPALLYFADCG